LIREEWEEFAEASRVCDVTGAADALADLLYVVYGAALEWGIPLDDVFVEVHRSNMSKVWPDGTVHYREDGKVLKPPTYSPADVAKVLKISAVEDLNASSTDE
jgi:predicted HAD superfamily Cof-like phosphohydrolase